MTRNELKKVETFKANSPVASVLMIREITLRRTRDGKPYLDLVLGDMTGRINAKVWEQGKELAEILKTGVPVGVRGQCEEYLGTLQLIISSIKPLSSQDLEEMGISWEHFFPATKRDRELMWESVLNAISVMEDPWLKELTMAICKDHEQKIKNHPASLKLHHAYVGGFLEHVYTMVTLAETAADVYPVNRDLLISGIILHDIGKLEELNGFPDNFYTDEGNFIGHTVQGYSLIQDYIRKTEGFPEMTALKLKHIILAHQGEYEYQAPKKPAFDEALLVHYIDELDARMNMMKQIREEDLSEGIWTSNRNYFRIPILKEEDHDE
ncbi:MAG: 3'-5' exoribonuclease YhaM family protein [Fidelibacterota bacterium]